jgi:predicted HAD superfamily phosphohydrolase YqeG
MPTVVIDFDGTIAEWAKYPEPGPPTPGVKEALQALRDQGYDIVVQSARTSDVMSKNPIDKEMEKRRMVEYLDEHEIPYDMVSKGDKPPAQFYIDDRGVEFDGDWKKVLNRIKEKGDRT